MAKAVLIMDMPEDCTMCKFWNSKDDECYATGAEELSLNSEEAKPDWCPLLELPEKSDHPEHCDNGMFDAGWNAFLDAIEGGVHE